MFSIADCSKLSGFIKRPDLAFWVLRIWSLLSSNAAKSQSIRIEIGGSVRCSIHRRVNARVPQLFDRRPLEYRCYSFHIRHRRYSSWEYSMRERARSLLEWQEAVYIAQASVAERLSEPVHSNATATLPRASSDFGSAFASTIAVDTSPCGSARDRPKTNEHAPRSTQPGTGHKFEKQSRLLSKQK